MLELALLLPALVILLLAIFLVGQYFNLQICLDMAVSAAIRAESLGYNGIEVFYEEWKKLTGRGQDSVQFRITKIAHVTVAYGCLELEMPSAYQNFDLPNPKIESRLAHVFDILRM